MSTETYTLELGEAADGKELAADLRQADGTLADSLHVIYGEHALETDGREPPAPRMREVTTDATRVQLDYQHAGDAFEVRVLGDEGVLLSERIEIEDWGLRSTEN